MNVTEYNPATDLIQFRPGKLLSTGLKFRPVIFIDRDGVINRNRADHVLNWQDFQFEVGAIEALRLLREAGYEVIVITNQAAIDRGLTSSAAINKLHSRMVSEIQKAGGEIKAVLCCPHQPEAGCFCRKPRPGLLLKAADQFEVDLAKSWFIGDYLSDIEAGLAAGCKPLLVLTGRGNNALEKWRQQNAQGEIVPKFQIKNNLLEAVCYILAEEPLLI